MAQLSSKNIQIKSKLKKQILNLNDGSQFDFIAAYLKGLSIERLRHILLYARTMRIEKRA